VLETGPGPAKRDRGAPRQQQLCKELQDTQIVETMQHMQYPQFPLIPRIAHNRL
jgi:hypothetical protein